MIPDTPISSLSRVGKFYSFKLKRLGVQTFEDLIYHFPFRYDDFSKIEQIKDVDPGEILSLQGVVWQIKNIRTPRGKFLTIATVADESATVEVIWFNQPFLTKVIKAGMPISLSGKAKIDKGRLKLISPAYEILRGALKNQTVSTVHTGRLVPIYPETEGVTSKWIRSLMATLLPEFLKNEKDFMPKEILKRHSLINLHNALNQIHFPQNLEQLEKARKRLAFDELFLIQLLSALRKKDWNKSKSAPKMKIDQKNLDQLVGSLPFKLTKAQEKATTEILDDLKRDTPMNRLLEGDVGSGKTVVAAIAAFVAHLNGYDVLLAAPTEILAFQHQKTLSQLLTAYGLRVGIWTGHKKSWGDVTCGTHALLNNIDSTRQIGLVIVDEQHRFGVAQRAKLFLKRSGEKIPHLLTMTATPIPRSLALTLYGDLDLSVLDEMPLGRQRIATFVVPNFKRSASYGFLEKQVKEGRQAFIITPFVEPSETMVSVKAAVVEFEKLKGKFSKTVTLGLLHGRLKSKEKETIIEQFKKNKINILVTTPVVEVGIDVPNASVMMIESSERFGLAQLHQLRGRVGRGQHKSYCLLFTESKSPTSLKRLKSLERIYVGFELAEIDLKMRGPGQLFGFVQSGFTNFKVADPADSVLISKAQKEARLVVDGEVLRKYPLLEKRIEKFRTELVQPN